VSKTQIHLPAFSHSNVFVLLENSLSAENVKGTYLFRDPVDLLICNDPAEIDSVLKQIESAVTCGLHAAGWFSFEVSYYLENRLKPIMPAYRNVPLIWFGLFTKKEMLTGYEVNKFFEIHATQYPPDFSISEFSPNVTKNEYVRSVKKLKSYLFEGDTYQTNYSFKFKFNFDGNLFKFYQVLRERQPCEYGAFIKTPDKNILSFSPELFIKKEGITITCKPMKGTIKRGKDACEDEKLINYLRKDPKSIAENVIIVDLLRNDVGKIADIGSVKAVELFTIETYKTLFQMTSTIRAEVDKNINLTDFIRLLFPSGSITGAPKVRTLEIINELEAEHRGIYTGAIGYFSPDNNLCLNVAIRTMVFNQDNKGEMGIGSGIVYDSDAEEEYSECLLKAEFLTGINKMNLLQKYI